MSDNNNKEKCVFWVGTGISNNSGAPCAPQLSNRLIYALCKNDERLINIIYKSKIVNEHSIPDHLIEAWKYLPEKINIYNDSVSLCKPKPKSYIRLETVLECIRQVMPNQIGNIFEPFTKLEPNILHYFLASALQKGHIVVTTNWDTLIENAADKLNIPINIRIWNPVKNKLENVRKQIVKSGVLLKIHGTFTDKNEFVAFVHQFIWGIPKDVIIELENILRDKLIICMGYSFNDFFDYDLIFKKFNEYNSQIFIVMHEEGNINFESDKKPINMFNFIEIIN